MALRSLQTGNLYLARHNPCHGQGNLRHCACMAVCGNLHPFPPFLMMHLPRPLKCPLLSSLQGESGFRAWVLPFPVLHQWRNLLLCFAKPGLLRLKGAVTGKGRTQMGSTHPRRLVTKAEVGGTLRAFGGKQPWFQTFSLWNRERIKFCCFKPQLPRPQETNTHSYLHWKGYFTPFRSCSHLFLPLWGIFCYLSTFAN